MVDVLIVIYVLCCITITLMCCTSVVYMIRDMVVDSRTDEDEPIDNEEDVEGKPVGNSEDATDNT